MAASRAAALRPAAPFAERRVFLEDQLDGHTIVLPVRRLDANGARAWRTVEGRGLDGFRGEGPDGALRQRSDEEMAKGEAAGLPRRGTWLPSLSGRPGAGLGGERDTRSYASSSPELDGWAEHDRGQ